MSQMKSLRTRPGRTIAAVAAFSLAAATLAGCATNESGAGQSDAPTVSGLSGTYAGAGASAQEAAQAAWIAAFQTADDQVTINYNPIGSGGGRKNFLEGAAVYAGSDSYMTDEELADGAPGECAADATVMNLPVYISPIAVVFNVAGVDQLNLNALTLANIFNGTIKKWNDPAIADLNEGTELPASAITVVHRSDDSGSTKNFTDYLNKNVPDVWTEKPEDKFPYTFAGAEGAQQSSGVVDAVTGGQGTIGYVDASKATALHKASLQVGEEFVAPSAEAAAKVVDASPRVEGRPEGDLAITLDRTTTESGVYPLVLVSYLVVCDHYADAKDGEFVKAYASYIVSPEGQAAASEGAGSAPVSPETAAALKAAVEKIK